MPSYTLWLTSGGNEPAYLERALHLVPIYFCPFAQSLLRAGYGFIALEFYTMFAMGFFALPEC